MLIVKTSFHDPAALSVLLESFRCCLPAPEDKLLIICIGSERHILDCLGPLTGTMLQTRLPELLIYGTLDQPLHARNLVKEMKAIRQNHPGRIELAIDASVGVEDEIGQLQLRQGGLLPGKAVAKNLPTVGNFSLTGVVDTRSQGKSASVEHRRGLAHVYHMAHLIQEALYQWYHVYS